MRERVELEVHPTPDQLERFRALSPADRYRWFAGLLKTTHGLASAEAKVRWQALKQAQSGGFLSVVCSLAMALDRADFDEAARWIGPECAYDTSSDLLRGVDAVVGAYATNHQRATRTMDRIRYRSQIEGLAPGVARVTFDDYLEHRGQKHHYRCQQEMSVGRSKLVERIVHRELPGQREALDTFLASLDVPR